MEHTVTIELSNDTKSFIVNSIIDRLDDKICKGIRHGLFGADACDEASIGHMSDDMEKCLYDCSNIISNGIRSINEKEVIRRNIHAAIHK